jgi:hypothetical protein
LKADPCTVGTKKCSNLVEVLFYRKGGSPEVGAPSPRGEPYMQLGVSDIERESLEGELESENE